MARTGFLAVVLFVAALFALHAADMPEDPQHLSGFVHTSLAPVWILSLSAFALGGIALSVELRRHLETRPARHAGIAMLWLAAFGGLVLAACPVDADPDNRTTLGLIHEDIGPPTFMLSAAGMLVLAPVFYRAEGWRRYALLSVVCGLFAFAFAIVYVVATMTGDTSAGIWQRLMVGFIVTWMFFVAARLLRGNKSKQKVPAKPMRKPARPRASCTR